MSVFSLCNAILLRGVWASQPIKDSMLSEKVLKLVGGVFSTIVGLELFDFSGN
jgi:hypothetical protein